MLRGDYKSSSELMSLNHTGTVESVKAVESRDEGTHISMIDVMKRTTLPTRKSVDFAILPPPKRPKPGLDIPWTAKQIVDGTFELQIIWNGKDSSPCGWMWCVHF